MKRAEIMKVARTQKHDASSTVNKRGMARRAKRQGAKRLRQHLRKTDTLVGADDDSVRPEVRHLRRVVMGTGVFVD